jgi:hypothetical protein
MTDTGRKLLDELHASLAGSRRRRLRLLAELDEHLRDAAAAERERGSARDEAEQEAVRRLGTPAQISALWNNLERRRRHRRRRYAAITVAAIAAGGFGATQYASGKSSPAPACDHVRASLCAPARTKP